MISNILPRGETIILTMGTKLYHSFPHLDVPDEIIQMAISAEMEASPVLPISDLLLSPQKSRGSIRG